jgi:copper chaperone CopZ
MRTAMAVLGVVVVMLAGTNFAPRATAQGQDEGQKTETCTLQVAGMTCGGCAAAVKSAAKKIDGVKDARVSYKQGTAEITYDPGRTNPDAIAKAITEKSGFKATVPKKEH